MVAEAASRSEEELLQQLRESSAVEAMLDRLLPMPYGPRGRVLESVRFASDDSGKRQLPFAAFRRPACSMSRKTPRCVLPRRSR